MRKLQDLFEKQIQERLKFSNFVANIIEEELIKKGIQLTSAQKSQLIDGLQKTKDNIKEGINIQIGDDGNLYVTNKNGGAEINIDITEGADVKMREIIEDIPSIINNSVETESKVYLAGIKKRASSILRERRKEQRGFNKHLNNKWGKVLDLLEVFILVSEEIGSEFNNVIRGDTDRGTSPRFEVLSRSHARSCQIALEILSLLRNGFADGAHARWRTLHEIAVETNIINKNEDDLARKYLDHDLVLKLQTARAFSKYDQTHGGENVTKEELEDLEIACKELGRLYGQDFLNENGWAVGLTGKGRITFSKLESLAEFAHMRPTYKMACLNVHGGSRGLLFRLGLSYEGDEEILLSGSSVFGLSNPVQNTAYSLLQITSALLTYDVNLDYLVAMNVLFELEQEIFEVTDQMLHV